MNHALIRRAALTAAGAFTMAATPLHAAEIDAFAPLPVAEPILAAPAEQEVAPVVAAPAAEVDPMAAREASLRPGDYLWEPERASEGQVEIVVSIPLQRAYVYRGATLIGVSTVSTGRRGHETPAGTFNILQKRREHYSNLYNNAPMPFMQRLTWDGIALHAGQIPGHPASHGCVRLPLAFARLLFSATEMGAAVHIIEQSPSGGEALAMVRGNGVYQGMGGPDEEISRAAH